MTFGNEFLFNKLCNLSFEDLDLSVQDYFSKTLDSKKIRRILTTNKFECKYGYFYKPEFMLYLKKENGLLTFGKINKIYVIDNDIYLHLEIFVSKEFNSILQCYEITSTDFSKVICFYSLKNVRPFEIHCIHSKMFLLMPCEIID